MHSRALRSTLVTAIWLALFLIFFVLATMLLEPVFTGLLGGSPFSSLLALLVGFLIALTGAAVFTRPLNRGLAGGPLPGDQHRRRRNALVIVPLVLLIYGLSLLGQLRNRSEASDNPAPPLAAEATAPAANVLIPSPTVAEIPTPVGSAPVLAASPAATTEPRSAAPTAVISTQLGQVSPTNGAETATPSPIEPPIVVVGSPGPDPTPEPTLSPPSRPPALAAGPSVLLADTFDEPALARLPARSVDPARYAVGYVGGEYLLRTVDPVSGDATAVPVPGSFADAIISVDARLVDPVETRLVGLGCRFNASLSHYRLVVSPAGNFSLWRYDSGRAVPLTDWQASPAIRRGNQSNHLELTCVGDTIGATVNGTGLAAVRDPTYSSGAFVLLLPPPAAPNLTAEARFDNLLITRP